MTIPHEDLIRAVLDGKTVQVAHPAADPPRWEEHQGDNALKLLVNHSLYWFRLKPEPRCVWGEFCEGRCIGVWYAPENRPFKKSGTTILRHEFDPDTGEYLRTVKEEA